MTTIKDRIVQIANYYEVSKPTDFAKKTGLSHQVASNYLKGARIPNAEALRVIKQTFDISADWLLTGEGEMLRQEQGEDSIAEGEKYKVLEERFQILLETHSRVIETNAKLTEELLLSKKGIAAGEGAECVDVKDAG